MSRRKDRERLLRRQQQDPTYAGFRGRGFDQVSAPEPTEGITCSVCARKRNVPARTIPEDRDSFVCLQCRNVTASPETDDFE